MGATCFTTASYNHILYWTPNFIFILNCSDERPDSFIVMKSLTNHRSFFSERKTHLCFKSFSQKPLHITSSFKTFKTLLILNTDQAWIWWHTECILNKGRYEYDIFGPIDEQWNLVLVIWEEAIGSNPESSNIPVYPNPDQHFWSFWRETSIERRLMKGFRDHFHLPFHPQSRFITNFFDKNNWWGPTRKLLGPLEKTDERTHSYVYVFLIWPFIFIAN